VEHPAPPGGDKPTPDRASKRGKNISAGVLVYRVTPRGLEVFLVHPGGPFWAKRDLGSWSIPKGEVEEGAGLLETAKREFGEETGLPIDGDFIALTPLRQPSGKVVYAWAVNGDVDASRIKSNTFSMEWPPRSGKQREFPEIDRGEWFALPEAFERLLPGQRGFLVELTKKLGVTPTGFPQRG
jgi:predicted NUDIX family NTP pyrophosphohydrolase